MLKRVAAVAAVCTLMLAVSGCTSGSTSQGSDSSGSAAKVAQSSEVFDATNYSVLATDPDAHKGAKVEIVGRIFTAVERDSSGTYIQMFADPKNSEWNTIVVCPSNLDVEIDDYVKVIGEVAGAFTGENMMGGEIKAVKIVATSVTKVDATAAGLPPTKTLVVGQSSTQHGVTITVDKVEFLPEEARVYVTVNNASKATANFYTFNAKAVQGSTQSDTESVSDYPEVQSEILPGVKSSGVVAFKGLDATQPVKLVFEASSNDYQLEFKPYQFSVGP